MPILESDIRLLASQTMSDAPEGGGAATGTPIADGVSNNMFPDVSELDHVYGRVQLRKVFVSVDTADTDTYLGANVIVMTPPENPDVSAVLFSTGDDFDTRDAASSRIEAYLAPGPSYPGYLFGDHIAGQMTLSFQQRTNVSLPSSGDTFVLVKFPGTLNEVRQFVRVIDVASATRTFTTTSGGSDVSFDRTIVSLTISDALLLDFPGFDAIYTDATVTYAAKTEILGTVVADAAKYYGVVPLTAAASTGDFGVTGDGIYAQLVPSSRSEVAIADARMNQQLAAVLSTGVDVSLPLGVEFDPAHPVYVGGGILPGTLVVTGAGGATLTDKGGSLVDSIGTIVGGVDYGSGLLTLQTAALGSGTDAKTFAYSRGAASQLVSESIGLDVTELTRRLTWVVSLDPVPAKGSLTVSYLSQGHWYELTDDGSGAVRGSDSSFGAGSLNFTTGTLSLTLGALPDSPSSIILAWAPTQAVPPVVIPSLGTSNVFAMAEIDMGHALGLGSLTITWAGGKSATDSLGFLVGDAAGTVDYTTGKVMIAPTLLPPSGTVLSAVATQNVAASAGVSAFTSSGSNWTGTIAAGAGIAHHSIKMAVHLNAPLRNYPGVDVATELSYTISDDGAGNLVLAGYTPAGIPTSVAMGTINYTSGAFSIAKTISLPTIQPTYGTVYPLGSGPGYVKVTGQEARTVTATVENGPVSGVGNAANVVYATVGSGSLSVDTAFTSPVVKTTLMTNGQMAAGATFTFGGKSYEAMPGGALQADLSPSTGTGIAAGTWVAATGLINITAWNTGASSQITSFSATQSPPVTVSAGTPLMTDGVTFRTASAPIASQGFQVIGTGFEFGDFNVTADSTGKISGTNVFGTIDYNTGVVSLRFGASTTDPVGPTVMDVSHFGLPGVTNVSLKAVAQESLRYNAVAYSYVPLDPTILGLDPVRLPSDGRVPVFRKGGVVVVHHTAVGSPRTVANGDNIDLGITRLARVRLVDSAGATIVSGYTVDLDGGHLGIVSTAGWAQPITIETRIEDMALLADAQISGQLKLSRPLTHDYPLGSFVSSALLLGDMASRVSTVFSQQTWTGVWSDSRIGSAIVAQYDDINHPVVVTNGGAVTERWALIFSGTTSFNIVGEHLGIVGVGNTGTNTAPLNPHTGTPYFSMASTGFGTGWAAGDVIRLNTVGALAGIWLARVVQQGDNTLDEDSFSVLVRGDVNA